MRILFVHNALNSFVRADLDILRERHDVDELDLSLRSRITSLPWRLARADLVFAWFASLHSLAPVTMGRVLRKPAIVVVGGYDTAALPEIGYGSMAHPLKRHVVRTICESASVLLANSLSARREVERNTRTSRPVHMVYHGFTRPPCLPHPVREPLVITAGIVSVESLERKGHRLFAEAAALVPEARFVLAGRWADGAASTLLAAAPANLTLPGYLSRRHLDQLMSRASVYVQASVHEGFGCAVAEAMLLGCAPVVSRRGALPELVGTHGSYVDELTPGRLASAIRAALPTSHAERVSAAEHIARNFSLDSRRSQLLRLVSDVAGSVRSAAEQSPAHFE